MQYTELPYRELVTLCVAIFHSYGFTADESAQITDVLLRADLYGIESHGIQRLVRYHDEIARGFVDVGAKPEIVHETPVSAVVDAHKAMGQLTGVFAMRLAIDKAKQSGTAKTGILRKIM